MRNARFWPALAATLAAVACSAFAQPQPPEPLFLPPGSTVEGKPIGEWTGRWWTWLLTTPLHRDPALDETGEHCGIDQAGPVWFLAGSFSDHPVTRRCKVPEGKYVLFPMYTGLTRPTPEQTQATCKTSQDKAARFVEAAIGLYATIDGEPVAGPERFRERTTVCFDPNGTGRAITAQDGYWIMLRPLPPGRHVLRYGRFEQGGRRNTDVSYVLDVGREASPRAVDDKPDEALPYPRPTTWGARTHSARRGKDGAGPTYEDFPRYLPAVIRTRPGFGLRDFAQRLVALILRDGKYQVVFQNSLMMGATADIRFTWPDVKARYAASEDLKLKMPHPLTIPITRIEGDRYRISVGGVDPNAGSSFAMRAEIVNDAARLVTRALDRREPVTDEETLRALRYKPKAFEELAGGDPTADLRARSERLREEAMDRAAAARPPGGADARQFTAGDLSAGGGELHAIGIYRGPERSGAPQRPSRVTVNVLAFTARPVVLLLAAYEPVEWYVVPSGATVSKIIALGYHRQTIVGAPANSERVSRSVDDGREGAYLGYGKDAEDVKRFFERAQALTGERPATFQGRYSGSEFIVDGEGPVRIEGKRQALPAGLRPPPVARDPGGVRFEAPAHVATVSADGLTVSSCLPGRSQAVRTNRSYVRGKVYFEATLHLPAGKPYASTNVGLAPAATPTATSLASPDSGPNTAGVGVLVWGEVTRYRDGDVFGIAADLDSGRLYFHVNGEWKRGAPGSTGIAIAAGRAYAAAVSVSGEPARLSAGCDGWTANFGKTPFKYAPPRGYASYDDAR